MSENERRKLNPKYTKKIVILQKLDHRGRSKFFILHKKYSWSSKMSSSDVPKYKRFRYTLDAAEDVALHLIKDYEKIFMS